MSIQLKTTTKRKTKRLYAERKHKHAPTDAVFNKLTVIAYSHQARKASTKGWDDYWIFRCDCGTEKIILALSVTSGHTKSCGCAHREYQKHGHGKPGRWSRTFVAWHSMKDRCLNSNNKRWDDYGGRGITIYPKWATPDGFIAFLADMGERPKGTSIDRIDNNGNYEPSNCRWATPKEQQRNMRSNVRITYQGRSLIASEWADHLGLEATTISTRLRRGWSIEKALSPPKWSRKVLLVMSKTLDTESLGIDQTFSIT